MEELLGAPEIVALVFDGNAAIACRVGLFRSFAGYGGLTSLWRSVWFWFAFRFTRWRRTSREGSSRSRWDVSLKIGRRFEHGFVS